MSYTGKYSDLYNNKKKNETAADTRDAVNVEGRNCIKIIAGRRECEEEDVEDTKKGTSGGQQSISGL